MFKHLLLINMKTTMKLFAVLLLSVAVFAFTGVEDGTYSVSVSDSEVTWLGTKVTGEHNGTIDLKAGNLEVVNGELKGGMFLIDMTTITCLDIEDAETNGKLVGHLKSDDFFSVSNFPEAKLEITSVKSKKSDNGNYMIKGDLTIKGITKPVEFPAQVNIEGKNVSAKATIVFDRSEYDVRYGSGSFFEGLGDKMIYDDVELGVNITAINM